MTSPFGPAADSATIYAHRVRITAKAYAALLQGGHQNEALRTMEQLRQVHGLGAVVDLAAHLAVRLHQQCPDDRFRRPDGTPNLDALAPELPDALRVLESAQTFNQWAGRGPVTAEDLHDTEVQMATTAAVRTAVQTSLAAAGQCVEAAVMPLAPLREDPRAVSAVIALLSMALLAL